MKVKLLTPYRYCSACNSLYSFIFILSSSFAPTKPMLGILPWLAFLSFMLWLKFCLLRNLLWSPNTRQHLPFLRINYYWLFFFSVSLKLESKITRTGFLSILFSTISLTALNMTWHIVHGGRILNEQVCKNIKRDSLKYCMGSDTNIAKNQKLPKS